MGIIGPPLARLDAGFEELVGGSARVLSNWFENSGASPRIGHGLAPESRDPDRTIDLHFRDRRREPGLRWLEPGSRWTT